MASRPNWRCTPHQSTEIDSSQLSASTFVLPEGMTLNPSAAAGLEACTAAQARIDSPVFGVCPGKIEDRHRLPERSHPSRSSWRGPHGEHLPRWRRRKHVDRQAAVHGLRQRPIDEIRRRRAPESPATPDETTGRVTVTFTETPEQPFSNLKLALTNGAARSRRQSADVRAGDEPASFVPFANPTPFPPAVRLHGRQQQRRRRVRLAAAVCARPRARSTRLPATRARRPRTR